MANAVPPLHFGPPVPRPGLSKVGVAIRLEIVTREDHGLITAGQSLPHDAIARLAADFLAEHRSPTG